MESQITECFVEHLCFSFVCGFFKKQNQEENAVFERIHLRLFVVSSSWLCVRVFHVVHISHLNLNSSWSFSLFLFCLKKKSSTSFGWCPVLMVFVLLSIFLFRISSFNFRCGADFFFFLLNLGWWFLENLFLFSLLNTGLIPPPRKPQSRLRRRCRRRGGFVARYEWRKFASTTHQQHLSPLVITSFGKTLLFTGISSWAQTGRHFFYHLFFSYSFLFVHCYYPNSIYHCYYRYYFKGICSSSYTFQEKVTSFYLSLICLILFVVFFFFFSILILRVFFFMHFSRIFGGGDVSPFFFFFFFG